jgi:S-adenosylmethionine decarboxylase
MTVLGTQILADLHGCDPPSLADVDGVRRHMLEAARRAGATIVAECFHQWSPQGVSGVVVIAESHLAIHTWPELGYAAVDFFTCSGELGAEAGLAYLCEAFRARRRTTRVIPRGTPPDADAGDRPP